MIKQSIQPQMMTFQVTQIEFDLDCDDDSISEEEMTLVQQELRDETIGTFWEAIDGDDLIEEITAATGWCIKSIDYRHVLNWNKMTMNKEQLAQFKYNYCERIIEDMDMDTLMTLAHDLLMDAYQSCTEEEIKEEILDLYDDEMLSDLMEGIK